MSEYTCVHKKHSSDESANTVHVAVTDSTVHEAHDDLMKAGSDLHICLRILCISVIS